MAADDQIPVKVEFTGGLELLFSNQRSHRVTVPAFVPIESPDAPKASAESSVADTAKLKPVDVDYLLRYLRDNLLKERVELFMEDDNLRPGILVLINDSDWELEGEGQYELKADDEIVFISTLHGG